MHLQRPHHLPQHQPGLAALLRRLLTTALVVATLAACAGSGDDADDAPTDGAETAEEASDGATDEATPVGSEEVTIPAGDMELKGTLRLPEAEPPYRAVVIVHGSGPLSRDGIVPGQLGLTLPQQVPVYADLAEGLRQRGYAVLTYDKRTCGPSNGCAENGYPEPSDSVTVDTFVEDAGATIDFLAARPDVSDVVAVGHSQGGHIVAHLLDRDLAAAMLVSTPAAPIQDVLAQQAETLAWLVEATGQEGAAAESAIEDARKLAQDVEAVAGGDMSGDDIGGASPAFWASWVRRSTEAPELVSAASIPIYALGGEEDWNVSSDDIRAWEQHISDGAVQVLPGITHALTYLGTSDPGAIELDDLGTEVDPSVVNVLATWLDEVFAG